MRKLLRFDCNRRIKRERAKNLFKVISAKQSSWMHKHIKLSLNAHDVDVLNELLVIRAVLMNSTSYIFYYVCHWNCGSRPPTSFYNWLVKSSLVRPEWKQDGREPSGTISHQIKCKYYNSHFCGIKRNDAPGWRGKRLFPWKIIVVG